MLDPGTLFTTQMTFYCLYDCVRKRQSDPAFVIATLEQADVGVIVQRFKTSKKHNRKRDKKLPSYQYLVLTSSGRYGIMCYDDPAITIIST
jgi:hypothetical protein